MGLRMEKSVENARILTKFLETQDKIKKYTTLILQVVNFMIFIQSKLVRGELSFHLNFSNKMI